MWFADKWDTNDQKTSSNGKHKNLSYRWISNRNRIPNKQTYLGFYFDRNSTLCHFVRNDILNNDDTESYLENNHFLYTIFWGHFVGFLSAFFIQGKMQGCKNTHIYLTRYLIRNKVQTFGQCVYFVVFQIH